MAAPTFSVLQGDITRIEAETFLKESPQTNLDAIMMVLFEQATQTIFHEAFAEAGLVSRTDT